MRGLLIGIGIVVAVWLAAVLALVAMGRRSQARELATLIPNLLMLFRGLLRDPRVPRSAKLWLSRSSGSRRRSTSCRSSSRSPGPWTMR